MDGYSANPVNQNQKPLKPYAAEQKRLFLTACMFGAGLLLYIVGNTVISAFLTSSPAIYNRYLNDPLFAVAVGMMNTSFSVFLPFLLIYFVMHKRRMINDLPLGGVYDPMNAVLLVFIGMGGCYVANMVTSYLTVIASAFGIESMAMQMQPEFTEAEPVNIFIQLLGYAVLPALFEEFAYRGVILQSLRRYGDWFAIFISALLFGILHGNIVQIPFAFLVGILLGYCTVVSGSMWVSIAIHFGNNLISVLQSILQTQFGQSAAYAATAGMMIVLFFLGIACFIAYTKRNKKIFRLRQSRFRFMKHSTALVLCAPTVLISCVYFLYATLMDIVGFYDWFTEGLLNLFSKGVS